MTSRPVAAPTPPSGSAPAAAPAPTEALTRSTLFGYSATEFPVALAATPMALFLPAFYAQDLGLSLTAVGLILMLARIWDVVTDPLIGRATDHTRSRIGRRRPWILAGTPLMMLSVYMLFLPGEQVSNTYLATWVFVLYLAWTMLNIPYFAWGAELSPDYHERTRITTVRTLFGGAGALLAIAVPAIGQQLFGYGGSTRQVLQIVALIALVTLPLAVGWLVWRVPERPSPAPSVAPLEGLRLMWRNRPFRRLLFGFTIAGLGPAFAGPLYVLFVAHVVGDTTAGPIIVLCFYTANLLSVGVWARVARRIGKHRAWLVGMGIMASATPFYMLIGPGDLAGMLVILVACGIGFGTFVAIPTSMKADVIDLDTLESGEDRAGLFFAAWSLAQKTIVAVGVGVALPFLDWFGFDPRGSNGPDQLLALRLFFSTAPMFCYAIGLLLVWRYPITEERHAELRVELDRARATSSGASA